MSQNGDYTRSAAVRHVAGQLPSVCLKPYRGGTASELLSDALQEWDMSHFCELQTRLGTCRATCHTFVGPQTTARKPPSNMSHLCWASDNGPEAADQYVQLLWGMRQHLGNCQATCPICVCPQTTARKLLSNMSHRCTDLINKMKTAARHVRLMWGLRRTARKRLINISFVLESQTKAWKLPNNMSHRGGHRQWRGNYRTTCPTSMGLSKKLGIC